MENIKFKINGLWVELKNMDEYNAFVKSVKFVEKDYGVHIMEENLDCDNAKFVNLSFENEDNYADAIKAIYNKANVILELDKNNDYHTKYLNLAEECYQSLLNLVMNYSGTADSCSILFNVVDDCCTRHFDDGTYKEIRGVFYRTDEYGENTLCLMYDDGVVDDNFDEYFYDVFDVHRAVVSYIMRHFNK